MLVLCQKFGLEPGPMPAAVKDADNRILLNERVALMGTPPQAWAVEDLQPLDVNVIGWTSERVERMYLSRFYELGGHR